MTILDQPTELRFAAPYNDRVVANIETSPASPPIHINGRFLTQPLTGVQRFCIETVSALKRRWPQSWPPPVVLTPTRIRDRTTQGRYSRDPLPSIGPVKGHAWEQALLPWSSRKGLLLNLGNLAPVMGRKQIVVIHDASVYSVSDSYSIPFRLAYRLVYQTLARRGRAHVVTVSAFSRRELSHHLNLPEASIEVISEGAEHIHASPPEYAVLARNELKPKRFVLVVGSLAGHKNVNILSDAAKMLASRGISLVITGDLDNRVYSRPATSLPHARYIGRVSDAELRALYEFTYCLVFPSLYEGFGLPAVEAMLCGCPVIAADNSSLPEICGDAAIFCDPTSPAAFAHAIGRLLDSPSLHDSLRSRGYTRSGSFTWDNTARGLIRIVDRYRGRG